MFLVGLTGGIACGKSTVSTMLTKLGCCLIDSDIVAREVVEPYKPAWFKIKQYFGDEILNEDETINRQMLGDIIFGNAEKRKKLNSITHPEIYRSIFWKIVGLFFSGHKYVILDLPLLYESGKMVKFMSKVIVVTCDEKTQIERLQLRNRLTKEEALQRIKCQMPVSSKASRADYVIDNTGTREETRGQVEMVLEILRNSGTPWKLRLIVLLVLIGSSTWLIWVVGQASSMISKYA